MQIVIDIPEEIYKASQILDVKYEDTVQIPLEVIANGTPLPKGHGDLIDRKELLKQPIDTANYPSNYVRIASVIIEADKAERSDNE